MSSHAGVGVENPQEENVGKEALELIELLEALKKIDGDLKDLPVEEFVKKYMKLKKKLKKLKEENKALKEGKEVKGEMTINLRRVSNEEVESKAKE